MKARLDSLTFSRERESLLTIRTRDDLGQLFDELHEYDVEVTIKKHRKKRSLDANGLYWASLTELAKVLRISNNRLHNMMIRQYGQPDLYSGSVVYVMLPDTEEAEEKAVEAESYHVKPTSNVKHGSDGTDYRAYMLMRGSSTYDSVEFSRLLEGLLDACSEAGVKVITGREE